MYDQSIKIIVEGNEGYKKSSKFNENDDAITCKKIKKYRKKFHYL